MSDADNVSMGTRKAAVTALKAFGVVYRSEGETSPNTTLLWRAAIEAQAIHRKASGT